jgi:hypothetical protein
MTSFTTIYQRHLIENKALDTNGKFIGIVYDVLINPDPPSNYFSGRSFVTGIKPKCVTKDGIH